MRTSSRTTRWKLGSRRSRCSDIALYRETALPAAAHRRCMRYGSARDEALFAVQVMAVGVDVAMLAWLFRRVGWNGGRAALGILVATALALSPVHAPRNAASAPATDDHPHPWRGRRPRASPARGPVGCGGGAPAGRIALRTSVADRASPDATRRRVRRPAHEYYRPDVDPSVNRLRALRRLFATQVASQGESLLDRFEADVRLWRVARDASSVRPGPRFAPSGLR